MHKLLKRDAGHYGANTAVWVLAIIGVVLLLLVLIGVLAPHH